MRDTLGVSQETGARRTGLTTGTYHRAGDGYPVKYSTAQEILQAIESAKVAVLLVSAGCLNSVLLAKNGLPPFLAVSKQGDATILPIIIRPRAFTGIYLGQFRAANKPSKCNDA